MKVTREFMPVTITFDSKQEFLDFRKIIDDYKNDMKFGSHELACDREALHLAKKIYDEIIKINVWE